MVVSDVTKRDALALIVFFTNMGEGFADRGFETL